jgi:glyoxylase-like metal-dependent hydrolase (beta-lactamase superfamily II)
MEEEKVFPGRLFSPLLSRVADGVWLLRGDIKHGMNIYFLEEDGGLIQYDAGTKGMVKAVRAVTGRLGALRRVVLGHSHTDHRGTAPSLGVPVYCHADEVRYAERDDWPDYWDMSKLSFAPVRWIYPTLHRRWDGGGVMIGGTVSEGDEVAGFRVVHFPGHAPGQIGLFRESDRLALVSDTVYFVDSERLKALPDGEATVPHPAWNLDTGAAKQSIGKLIELNPATVCAGHEHPLTENIRETLERAAAKH